MPDELKKIRLPENALRFAALIFLLIMLAAVASTNFDTGEEIILTKPIEPEFQPAEKNIVAAIGAESETLYVYNPFEIEPEIEPVEMPPPEPEIIPLPDIPIFEPAAQVETEKFILRGTAIIGENKTALLQKSADSSEENFFMSVGDSLQGKIIIDIAQDSLTFDDGTILKLNLPD